MYDELKSRMEFALDSMREAKLNYEERLGEISTSLDKPMKCWKSEGGGLYYSLYDAKNNSIQYLGDSSNEEVNRIKEAKFIRKSLEIMEKDIKALERALKTLLPFDYDYINLILPKVYRDASVAIATPGEKAASEWKEQGLAYKARFSVYNPEELKVRTKDDSYVRSKSEAMIYNALLDRGVTFIYELPMKIGGKTIVPDFTVLTERDYKEVIIEHQGLMDSEFYRKRFADKVHAYLKAGYIQGINIFYTFDSLNGGLDIMPVEDVINSKIKKRD